MDRGQRSWETSLLMMLVRNGEVNMTVFNVYPPILYHITAPAPEPTSMSTTFLLPPTTTPQTDACGEYRVMYMYCLPYHPTPGVLPICST